MTRVDHRRASALMAIAVLIGACGGNEIVYAQHVSPTGLWQIEIPEGDTETSDETVGALVVQLWTTPFQEDAVLISETAVPAGIPVDMDAAVQGGVDGMAASLEAQLGTTTPFALGAVQSGQFAGGESRDWTASAQTDGEPIEVRGRLFFAGEVLHSIAVVDVNGDDGEMVTHVFDSLTSN